METSNQPKETNCFHLHPSLQDGEYQSPQRSPPPRNFLDLKDAYLTVPMNHQYWKFLRFVWKGTMFKFKTLPFGLATAPITFTKLLHLVAALLCSQGIRLLIYLDDILLAAQTSDMVTHQCPL